MEHLLNTTSSINSKQISIKTKQPTLKRISIVVFGHFNSGKSTLIGHLLYICGKVTKDEFTRSVSLSKHFFGCERFKFAFLVDSNVYSIFNGISYHSTRKWLETYKNDFTLIDTPGHPKWAKNGLLVAGCRKDAGSVWIFC